MTSSDSGVTIGDMASDTCEAHGLPVAMCLACAPRREATTEEMVAYLRESIARRLAVPDARAGEWFMRPDVGVPLGPFLENTEEHRRRLMEAAKDELTRSLAAMQTQVLQPIVPIQFETLSPSPEDKAMRILPHMQFTARLQGTVVRYPASVAYMDGIADDYDEERDIAYDAREEYNVWPTLMEIDRPRRRRETHPITGLRGDLLIVDDPHQARELFGAGDDRVDAVMHAWRHVTGTSGEK